RRGRHDEPHLLRDAASLHRSAAPLDPAHDDEPRGGALQHPGPAARSVAPAEGVPLRDALRVLDGGVRRRGAAARRPARARPRLRPPGRAGGGAEHTVAGRAVSENLLELRDVVKEYPVTSRVLQRRIAAVHAVSGVSLEVPAGATFGLVGESGCGKTTVGRMIVGLERPTAGSIVFEGRDLAELAFRERRRLQRQRQFVFQDPYASLAPRMRVGAIVREPLAVQRLFSRNERSATVRRLLEEVGLPRDAANRYPHEFSGGQRQRIGLARALALNPRLIVADEPVSALDVSIRSQVLNLMRELQRRHDLTYIVISHDLTVVRYVSDLLGV